MAKLFLWLILLCGLATVDASEVQYIIRPSQSQCCGDQYCNSNVSCMDTDLTLSQFVDNFSNYVANHTTLIFSPGNYSLESELIVESVHSFSMYAWPGSLSKAVIACGHNSRFEFRRVAHSVTVSGLEFEGCFENQVISVGLFQLENSAFLGGDQALVSGTVLSIVDSVASLEQVVFISILDALSDIIEANCTAEQVVSITIHKVAGIFIEGSSVSITHSRFEGNNVGLFGGAIVDDSELASNITIVDTTFINNRAESYANLRYECNITSSRNSILYANGSGSTVKIYDSKFEQNVGAIIFGRNCTMFITHTKFIGNRHVDNTRPFETVYSIAGLVILSGSSLIDNTGPVLDIRNTNMNLSHSEFIGNQNLYATVSVYGGKTTSIDHVKFINNTGFLILRVSNIDIIRVTHSEFVDNTVTASQSFTMVYLDGAIIISLCFNEFINNEVTTVVYIPYYNATAKPMIANNLFINNSALFELFIDSDCRPDFSLSLGSSHCIQCSENRRWRDLIGIVVAAFIAGIALVIFMLALNMTVAVGTLNGILFYAHIITANTETYFLPFTAPSFVTVFISWLNLDVGFDVCFVKNEVVYLVSLDLLYKALLQSAFPAYVIVLVIIVIVASEYSSKFANMVSKGNPVAVLATMILISYAKFLNVIFASYLSVFYGQPAYGSRNVDVKRLPNVITIIQETNNTEYKAVNFFLLGTVIFLLLLCVIFTVLVFSWQWLLRYQDKAIFKWVKYQKLHHFLEPYHAPYTVKYRYWTGLLLFVRALLHLISLLNFSLDPRVDLMAVIFIVGGLILLKGVTAKRVYKNWPLDVMETAIYFNLVAFSALTWYNIDFGGNQVAVAYTSVMIIFILLLGVIAFHVLRYTRLYKCSFVEKAFKWTSFKLLEKKPKEQPLNDAPEELDGYQLGRSAAGDQELPTITYSVVEVSQPIQSQ